MPEDVLERGVSNKGDTSRFRKLFTKLRAGVSADVVQRPSRDL